ncbi:DUF1659 domain-containing protein [Clostridium rectalis]|uniref:DUF1659 domain-containing protein n=1 Tax=Clostridium rectalis TaxID=2040295 RepID=UPI0013DDD33C|nr:DUF1659 domain-containing protein [Clostridium rectalis]
MAVQSHKLKTSMIIEYVVGVDNEGKDILKRQKFSNLKLDASDEALYEISDAFNPLMEFGITSIKKQDDSLLVK